MLNPVLERFVDRLTDAYNKNPESNVMKLARLTTEHIQQNQDVYQRMSDWKDVDKAEGRVLDMHGADVKQARGQLPDQAYRVLIKSKIKRNLSNGSINAIIDFVSFILQINERDVTVTELWQSGKPAALQIIAPVGPISNTGLSVRQFGTLLDLIVAGGVRAESIFEGTFEFSSVVDAVETDANKGFANLSQTTGGTLGLLYDPANDYELPI